MRTSSTFIAGIMITPTPISDLWRLPTQNIYDLKFGRIGALLFFTCKFGTRGFCIAEIFKSKCYGITISQLEHTCRCMGSWLLVWLQLWRANTWADFRRLLTSACPPRTTRLSNSIAPCATRKGAGLQTTSRSQAVGSRLASRTAGDSPT